MEDKVSVIVPVYNVEEYLESCVNSLWKQTYKNIEIILVDDCSTDNSLQLCYKLQRTGSNIVPVLHHDSNGGQEATRNSGLDVATGDWIMFLDSDDTYCDDAIEKMVAFATDNQCDLVFGEYKAVWKDREFVVNGNMKSGLYTPDAFARHLLVDVPLEIISCVGAKIYNRKFMEENALRFNRHYKYNEDLAFALQALSRAERIGYFSFPYYNYLQRESGSIQSSYRAAMFSSILKARLLLRDFMLVHHGYEGKARELFVRMQFLLAYDALKNEARYADYSAFRDEFGRIRKSDIYSELSELSSVEGVRLSKLMLKCLKKEKTFALYVVMKIAVRLKN